MYQSSAKSLSQQTASDDQKDITMSSSQANVAVNTGQLVSLLGGSQEHKHEPQLVALGQNSIAFSLLEFSALSPHLGNSLLIEDRSAPTLILQDFWLDKVDESRLDTPWGQYPNEYPLFFRQKLNQLFPHYPQDQRITFRMFKQLRLAVIEDLKKSGVQVISDNVVSIDPIEHQHQHCVVIKLSKGDPIILPHHVTIINTLNQSRLNPMKNANGRELPAQTTLYEFKQGGEPPTLIVFGLGLSGVWVKEQCPHSQIVYMVDDIKKATETLDKLTSRNQHIHIPKESIIAKEDVWVMPAQELIGLPESNVRRQAFIAYLEHKQIVNRQFDPNMLVIIDKKTNQIVFMGLGYNATGFEPVKFPNAGVAIKNIHYTRPQPNQEVAYGPQNVPPGALMDRYTDQEVELAELHGFSLEQKVLLIPLEVLFFQPKHLDWLFDYMKFKGLVLVPDFFTRLEQVVKALEDTPANPLKVIKDVYAEIYPYQSMRTNFNTALDKLYELRQQHVKAAFQSIAPQADSQAHEQQAASSALDVGMIQADNSNKSSSSSIRLDSTS